MCPTFHDKVSRIADALQAETRTLLTEIDVPNPTARCNLVFIARLIRKFRAHRPR